MQLMLVRGLCLAVTGHSSLVVRGLDLAVRGDLGSATLQLFVVFLVFFFAFFKSFFLLF